MDNNRPILEGSLLNPEKVMGDSAYDIAVKNGFQGTEEEWLASLSTAIDTTLTQTGKAADAKVVGDLLKGKMDKMVTLDFTSIPTEDISQGEQGISWGGECEIETNLHGYTDYVYVATRNRMPIIAGDGISFEVEKKQDQNSSYELLKINNTRDYSRDFEDLRKMANDQKGRLDLAEIVLENVRLMAISNEKDIDQCFRSTGEQMFELVSSTQGSLRRFQIGIDDDSVLICNPLPIYITSAFDSDGDGAKDTYGFIWKTDGSDTSLPIVIDAVRDIVDNNGVHQEPNSHYMKYDEVEAGIGTLPPHVYCYDNSSTNYLRYILNVEKAGIYELAAYIRIKDVQRRGATYTINKGSQYEHAFVTTHEFNNPIAAGSVCNSTQATLMRGMQVYLQQGVNTIHITNAVGVTKNQHFRGLCLGYSRNLPNENSSTSISMEEAEEIGARLPIGARLYENYDILVTFNNGAPRETDGFCRVRTPNGNLMSIKNIILAEGQTMPVNGSTVTLRGKIGCVNSAVNGSLGKEARIFDATILS